MALSFIEARYIIATEAIKEALWLKGIAKDLVYEQGTTVIQYEKSKCYSLIQQFIASCGRQVLFHKGCH